MVNARTQADRKKDPEKWDKIYKKQHQDRKAKYGEYFSLQKVCQSRKITIAQYHEMLLKQNEVCAICFMPETRKLGIGDKKGEAMRLVIDHCHETNKVRGLLCHSCNLAIGKFRDNTMTMYRAIRYIKQGGLY